MPLDRAKPGAALSALGFQGHDLLLAGAEHKLRRPGLDIERLRRVCGHDGQIGGSVPLVHQPQPGTPGRDLLGRHLGCKLVKGRDGQCAADSPNLARIGLRDHPYVEGVLSGGAVRIARRVKGEGDDPLLVRIEAQWLPGQGHPRRGNAIHGDGKVVYLCSLVQDAQSGNGALAGLRTERRRLEDHVGANTHPRGCSSHGAHARGHAGQ